MDASELRWDYQTPMPVARYMADLLPLKAKWIYEPTPGNGNLSHAAVELGYNVIQSPDFFLMNKSIRFDGIIMNPPFSSKSMLTDHKPPEVKEDGMALSYWVLEKSMGMSDNIVALMPWFYLLDSDVRVRATVRFGLRSITALPRKTFNYARIQTCVLDLQAGYFGKTEYRAFPSTKL